MILVTGAAGYIGSHLALFLKNNGYDVIGLDNYSSDTSNLLPRDPSVLNISLHNLNDLRQIAKSFNINHVIHLAGLKTIDEEIAYSQYHLDNVLSTSNLIDTFSVNKLKSFFFSSTAGVYRFPHQKEFEVSYSDIPAMNKYAKSKFEAEILIRDKFSNSATNAIIFRFFNVAGTFSNGTIEINSGNLIPRLIQNSKRGISTPVFGNNWPTQDGSCVRDFVHVYDICKVHLKLLTTVDNMTGLKDIINIGSARGYSVFEVINSLSKIVGEPIPHHIIEPRKGDQATSVANCDHLKSKYKFLPNLDLDAMLSSYLQKYNSQF